MPLLEIFNIWIPLLLEQRANLTVNLKENVYLASSQIPIISFCLFFSESVFTFGYFFLKFVYLMRFTFPVDHKENNSHGGMGMEVSSVVLKYQRTYKIEPR